MRDRVEQVVAAVVFVCLSPLLMAIAVAVRVRMGGPVMFRSPRGGLEGREFDLLKFRTMREPQWCGEPDVTRITPLGRWLRKTSLDELPSLWNIVRGDMRFVGPRPFHSRYVARYDADQRRRLSVKPGLTGWAQVNGRNGRSWEEKFALDVWYVEHQSLVLDARILMLTVRAVVRGSGVDHSTAETMPEFRPVTHPDGGDAGWR
jgi:sugar transferase EpsL